MNNHIQYMKEALKEAKKAAEELEVPVGAVIVHKDKIIARGRNRREISKNALFHAEIEAINNACKKLNSWRLIGCTLYVTLEPCPMCAGAIINSRISEIIYGANDPKAGSCGSVTDLFSLPYNHKPVVTGGILKDECAEILTNFFKNLRK
ncbi:MAG: tRNA adenosine(34) deaminase TadA [Clostridia bacterium]|nr:tRNA adenosine(34) deaminase TadA [Clostridia bacterium]